MDYTDTINDQRVQLSSLGTDLKQSGSLGNAPTHQYFGQIIEPVAQKVVSPPVIQKEISKPIETLPQQPTYDNKREYGYE